MSSTNGNGAAAPVKPTNGVKTTVEIKPAPKTNALAVVPKVADLPPLEDRLHKLNVLFDLQGKYNRLQSSLIKLQNFELTKEGERCKLSIYDDNRNEFATHNPEIIAEVKEFLKVKIKEKIEAVAPQLNW